MKKPAIVKFIGKENDYHRFTKNKNYEAYFLEYWQGVRNNLHVKDDDGKISDFNPFEDFVIISDEDNVLNTYTATVKCITNIFDDTLFNIKYGKEYLAIGRDKDGMLLVKDESEDCYFYPSSDFEIIEDKYGILNYESVYYSYSNIQI